MFLSCALLLALMQPQAPLGPLRKPNVETQPQNQRQIPTVTFTLNWPATTPQFVKIEVESAGRASYLSQSAQPQSAESAAQPQRAQTQSAPPEGAESQKGKTQSKLESTEPQNTQPQNSDQQPYTERFTFSQATREKIFELAKAARYFNGKFDFHGKVAQTGTKTLAYVDEARDFEIAYNWSENAAIEQLTQIFEATSETVEAGRKLRELMRYDPLGLDDELAKIEQAAQDGQMAELGILKPLLEQIASDGRYMHVAQQRARRLLELAGREGGAAGSE